MNAIKSIVAVLLLSIVPLTAMGQKVNPNWAKPGSQQKNVKNELTVTNHGAFKSQLTIKEVMRAGNLVKITYTFKNLEIVKINEDRYESYLRMLQSLEERKPQYLRKKRSGKPNY